MNVWQPLGRGEDSSYPCRPHSSGDGSLSGRNLYFISVNMHICMLTWLLDRPAHAIACMYPYHLLITEENRAHMVRHGSIPTIAKIGVDFETTKPLTYSAHGFHFSIYAASTAIVYHRIQTEIAVRLPGSTNSANVSASPRSRGLTHRPCLPPTTTFT